MASRQYDFTLTATNGSTRTIQAMGTQVRMVSTPGGAVRVKTDRGDTYDLEAGQGFKVDPDKPFRELYVSTIVGIAQTGSIFVGDADYFDTRIPGQVQIVDGTAANVAADLEYVGSFSGGGTPAAGQYTNMQVWNGTTDKAVIITAACCQFSDLAQIVRFRLSGSQIAGSTTLFGSKRAKVGTGGTTNASVLMAWRNTAALSAGNDNANLLGGFNFPMYVPAGANQTELKGLDRAPLMIPPGVGLLIAAGTAASDFQMLINLQIRPWVYGTP